MVNSEHLTEHDAQSIADGTADPLDADRWLSHLEKCGVCASRFQEQLDTSSLDVQLRDAMTTEDPYPKESGFLRLSGWVNQALATQRAHQQTLQMSFPPRIGNYELIRMIGYGGMGVVYEAKQSWLNRNVAIKLMRSDKGIDQYKLSQFTREFEAVGRLDHPGIVRAIDAGCSQGHAFLVMELVDGLDLEKVRQRTGVLSEANVIEVAMNAAEGLAHAHQHGVIHRDVKPSNLMLGRDRASSAVTVRIMDLGLGQVESALISDSPNTPSDNRVSSALAAGTAGYQAPELIAENHDRRNNDVSSQSPMTAEPRTDIYALGATLLSLSTKLERSQWTSQNAIESKHLSKGFRNLAAAMVSHCPDDRPATMNDVLQELKRLRSNRDGQSDVSDLSALLESACRVSESDTAPDTHSWDVLTQRVLAQTEPVSLSPKRPLLARLIHSPAIWIVALFLVLSATYLTWSYLGKETKLEAESSSKLAMAPPAETLHEDPEDAKPLANVPLSQQVAHEVIRLGGRWETTDSEGDTLGFESADSFPVFPVEIDWIMLGDSEANDQFIDLIVGLKHLNGLVLPDTNVTDVGVRRLGQMKSLQFVYLYGTDITDQSVAELAKLPKLTKLVISETDITNKSLVMLENCSFLKRLAIKNTRADFRGMPSIGKLTALEHLDIRDIDVQDEHLSPLLSLNQLRTLDITWTGITAVGIEKMISLPSLRLIITDESQISASKAGELMQRYPRVKIRRDPQE